jgi:hypothetical protein
MRHPYFEAVEYPWSRPEATQFHEVLFQAIPDPSDADLRYKKTLAGLPPLPPAASISKIWAEALQNLTGKGALRRFCEKVRQDFEDNLVFVAAVDAIFLAQADPPSRPGEPGQPRQSGTSSAALVLDRAKLRLFVAEVEKPDNPHKVIIVRGERGSGKSHGRFLFEPRTQDQGETAVYLCQDTVTTVEEAIYELFIALEAADEIPPMHTTDNAYYREVCSKLREVAQKKGRVLWVTVDDLGLDEEGTSLMDPEIRAFFEQLALNLVTPTYRRWFRLMLIHYPDGPVPTKWKRDILLELRIGLQDVGAHNVADVLRERWVLEGRTVIEDELTALAQGVVAEADALTRDEPHERLRRIHQQVMAQLDPDLYLERGL